jgi:4-hydroxybenzoate polyprenyltransferase
MTSGAQALVRACHPVPAIGVTAFVTVLAAVAGNDAATCALLAAAILTGQLTIGWSNDRHDFPADRMVDRMSKPLAAGEISLRTIDVAITLAAVATAPLSLALGWRAGLLHLGAVAVGWLYNFVLKGTWFSWLPYAVSFGALPAIATFALPGHPAPAAWAIAAGACLGTAANFTNALTDLSDDRVTGFRGAPTRIGGRASLVVGAVLAVASTLIIAIGVPGPADGVAVAGVAVGIVAVAAAIPVFWHRAESRLPFYGLMAFVPVDIAMIIAVGQLH